MSDRLVSEIRREMSRVAIAEDPLEEGYSTLHVAARLDLVDAVSKLVQEGASVDIRSRSGETPLHVACRSGSFRCASELARVGADLSACSECGATPLFLACSRGHAAIVRDLLARGARACAGRLLPLHDACERGDVGIVRELLSGGASAAAVREGDGRNAVHAAVLSGSADVLRAILGAATRASLDALGRDGYSPLMLAATRDDVESARALLSAGCDIHLQNAHWMDAMCVASLLGRVQFVLELLENGARVSPWHLCASCLNGHEEVMDVLLRAGGAGALGQSSYGFGALHVAAAKGRTGMAVALCRAGAPLEARCAAATVADLCGPYRVMGATPLHFACINGHTETADRLLALGANPNQTTNIGCTPLMMASANGHPETALALVASGADIDTRDSAGFAAIHFATCAGDRETVLKLLRLGADPDVADLYGETPVHKACLVHKAHLGGQDDAPCGHVGILRDLLRAGARHSVATSDKGETPLHLACVVAQRECAIELIQSGASLSARDADGRTPLHRAFDPAIVRALLDGGADVGAADNVGETPLSIAEKIADALPRGRDVLEMMRARAARVGPSAAAAEDRP